MRLVMCGLHPADELALWPIVLKPSEACHELSAALKLHNETESDAGHPADAAAEKTGCKSTLRSRPQAPFHTCPCHSCPSPGAEGVQNGSIVLHCAIASAYV